MKNKIIIMIVVFVLVLTQFACRQSAPAEVFPEAFDPATGTTYKVVPIFRDLDQPYPDDFQLEPVSPPSEDEINSILYQWGLGTGEVNLLFLDASWTFDENGNVIIGDLNVGETVISGNTGGFKMAAPAPQNGCSVRDARAFAIHMAERLVKDGMDPAFLTSLLSMLADGTASADIMADSGDGRRLVVKLTHRGIPVLLVLGKAQAATLFVPSSGSKVSSMLKGLTQRPGGSKKAIAAMAGKVADFFRCVRENWPSTKEQVGEAEEAHGQVYKGREAGEIPDNFPTSIPFSLNGTEVTLSLVDAKSSQFTDPSIIELTDEEMFVFLEVGLITVVVIAAPEIAIPSLGLVWASGAVH